MADHNNHHGMAMGTTQMPNMNHNHMDHMKNMDHMEGMNKEHMAGMNMHHMDGMNMSDSCGMMGMMMYFHTGKCEYILFEALRTTSAGGMGGACVAIFFLAVFYEGLKVLREHLLRRTMLGSGNKYKDATNSFSPETSVVEPGKSKHNGENFGQSTAANTHPNYGSVGNYHFQGPDDVFIGRAQMLSCGHLIQTLLHVLQVFISYCLMLVFMTYNAWLCIAVVLGAGAGYFLFGWRRAVVVDINEHCH